MLRLNYQTLDFMTVNDIGYDYTVANREREFKVLVAISDAANISHGQLASGQEVSFLTTLSKKKCYEVVEKLGLVPRQIYVSKRLGILKKEVTVKF